MERRKSLQGGFPVPGSSSDLISPYTPQFSWPTLSSTSPSWFSLAPLVPQEVPATHSTTHFQTPPDPRVPRPDLAAAMEPIALFPPATFPPSSLISQSTYDALHTSTGFLSAPPPVYLDLSPSSTSPTTSIPAPYLGQVSIPALLLASHMPAFDGSLATMSHGDLLATATALQAELANWRALEEQRFQDDRDPATVKAFLRMANEEVERLQSREQELGEQLAHAHAQHASALAQKVEPLRGEVSQLKKREQELLNELHSCQAQQARAVAREVEPLQKQIAGLRKREGRLKEELQRATASLAALPALQREVEGLRGREAALRAELQAFRQASQEHQRLHSEGESGGAALAKERDAGLRSETVGDDVGVRPYFGLELADGIKYLADHCDMTNAFGAVKVVTAIGPAHVAGLEPEDLIVSLNGIPIETLQEFNQAVRQIWAGDVVSIDFDRNGQTYHTVIRTENTTSKSQQPSQPAKGR